MIGFIPAGFVPKEITGSTIGSSIIVKDMHTRKLNMYRNGDYVIGNSFLSFLFFKKFICSIAWWIWNFRRIS